MYIYNLYLSVRALPRLRVQRLQLYAIDIHFVLLARHDTIHCGAWTLRLLEHSFWHTLILTSHTYSHLSAVHATLPYLCTKWCASSGVVCVQWTVRLAV